MLQKWKAFAEKVVKKKKKKKEFLLCLRALQAGLLTVTLIDFSSGQKDYLTMIQKVPGGTLRQAHILQLDVLFPDSTIRHSIQK